MEALSPRDDANKSSDEAPTQKSKHGQDSGEKPDFEGADAGKASEEASENRSPYSRALDSADEGASDHESCCRSQTSAAADEAKEVADTFPAEQPTDELSAGEQADLEPFQEDNNQSALQEPPKKRRRKKGKRSKQRQIQNSSQQRPAGTEQEQPRYPQDNLTADEGPSLALKQDNMEDSFFSDAEAGAASIDTLNLQVTNPAHTHRSSALLSYLISARISQYSCVHI